MVAGGILTIIILAMIANAQLNEPKTGINLADKPIEFTSANKFEVFQVLSDGALANCEEKSYSLSLFIGPVVFILADGQNQFYDKQVISIPKGKKAMQIGTYRYTSKLGEKTVPVIKFQ